jgi:hypothetical protein
MTAAEARKRITQAFAKVFGISPSSASKVLPLGDPLGKLYEAYVLTQVVRELRIKEGLQADLVNSRSLTLKAGGGGINRSYPFVQLKKNGRVWAELWTDIYFTTLSCDSARRTGSPLACDYHEMDIVVVPPRTSGLPCNSDIWLAVECKARPYGKNLLREILGIRRELSYLDHPVSTRFTVWPRSSVPANPPSCIMVYSTDPDAANCQPAGDRFGIDFVHCPIK